MSGKLLKVSAVLLASALCAGCVHTRTTNDVPACERLVPQALLAGVQAVPLPEARTHDDGHDDAQPWIEGFIGQTGQLEKANERAPAVDHIYRECLVMHREALKRSTRRFLGIF